MTSASLALLMECKDAAPRGHSRAHEYEALTAARIGKARNQIVNYLESGVFFVDTDRNRKLGLPTDRHIVVVATSGAFWSFAVAKSTPDGSDPYYILVKQWSAPVSLGSNASEANLATVREQICRNREPLSEAAKEAIRTIQNFA